MGAIRNKVKARTKEGTWKEFQRVRDEVLEEYDTAFVQWPQTKKEALEQMKKESEGWVLDYRIKV